MIVAKRNMSVLSFGTPTDRCEAVAAENGVVTRPGYLVEIGDPVVPAGGP